MNCLRDFIIKPRLCENMVNHQFSTGTWYIWYKVTLAPYTYSTVPGTLDTVTSMYITVDAFLVQVHHFFHKQ